MTTGSSIRRANAVARPRGLSRQLHWKQHEWGRERLVQCVGLGVVQHPEREEQRVDTLLLDREPRLLIESAERAVERFRGRGGLQELVGVPIVERGGVVWHERRLRCRCIELLVGPPVGARRRGRTRIGRRGLRRLEAHLPFGEVQQPEDLGRVLVDDGDGRHFRRAEVERAVPLGEVEEPSLPCVDRRRDPPVSGTRGGPVRMRALVSSVSSGENQSATNLV